MGRVSLPTPTLDTARLRLRPFASADADALFALHSSASVLRRPGMTVHAPSASSRRAGRWSRPRLLTGRSPGGFDCSRSPVALRDPPLRRRVRDERGHESITCASGIFAAFRVFASVDEVIKAGALLLVGGLLTACAAGTNSADQTPPPKPCPTPAAAEQTLPAAQAVTEADCFLAGLVLPTDARRVKSDSLPGLTTTPVEPVCKPLIDESRLWTVAGTATDVQTFLRSHPAKGMTVTVYPPNGYVPHATDDPVWWVSEVPTGAIHDDNQLVVSVLDGGKGVVDIRADGLVIPAGAGCASGGGSSGSKN